MATRRSRSEETAAETTTESEPIQPTAPEALEPPVTPTPRVERPSVPTKPSPRGDVFFRNRLSRKVAIGGVVFGPHEIRVVPGEWTDEEIRDYLGVIFERVQ